MKEIVGNLYATKSDGFYTFAYFLRMFDQKLFYTSQILSVKTIPNIIVEIIESNSWISGNPGKMAVRDKFALKLYLSEDFILQYEKPNNNRKQ